MEENLNSKEDKNININPNSEDSKQKKEPINNVKEEDKKESNNEINKKEETPIDTSKENINSSNNGKVKRHRRTKKDIEEERKIKCPDCDKCYLSSQALITHRRGKHGFNSECEKKSRGRPKKDDQNENCYQNALNNYNEFLNQETRKIKENEEKINLDTIKENFTNIFTECKNNLFKDIDNIEKYPFYQLVINNWNKTKFEFPNECLSDNYKNENTNNLNKYNSPPLEVIFFLYIKELSNKTNKSYFLFVNKFIILFRECINSIKKDQVKDEYKTEKANEYSQIYSAEVIPESCNDFFIEFMQPNNYYGLKEMELIEEAQHFCFWLYTNKYTLSYLTLL